MGNKWVFRIKQNPNNSIAQYKAHFVAKGFHQHLSINFHETFSLVTNPITVYAVLSIARNQSQVGIHQLDVNNVFFNGHLMEEVYMEQQKGMRNVDYPHNVYHLHKAICGLKQAPRAWY